MNKLIQFCVFFFLILTSCNNQTTTETTDRKTAKTENIYIAGKTYQNIKCKKDSTQKYTAYFPKNYDQTKKTPIIVVFDAHARAKFATNKFKNVADRFNYLIIVSENIKNGLKTVNHSINILFEDFFSRFKIDKTRVYAAGFSGGARIANSIAIYKGGIAGVIACSGGLPKQGIKIKNKFDFVGIVGLKDFNYQEMKILDNAFDKNDFNNKLIIFDGKHKWPNETIISDAVVYLEIIAMKRKLIPVNDNLIRLFIEKSAKKINSLIIEEKEYEAYLLYKGFLQTLNGLYDISDYEKSFNVLLKSPKIEQQKNKEEQISEKEAIKQEKFIGLFKKSEFNSLKLKITELQIKAKKNIQNYYERRLLNYVEMLCYVFTNKALESNDFKTFNQLIVIYELINQKNADLEFLKACKYAINKNNTIALKSLNKAVDLGFFDKNRLLSSSYFKDLQTNKEFIRIAEKINN